MSIMRMLLNGGADTERRNAHGSTTLINACRCGYLECVKLLVEHGANLYACGVGGRICLHAALEKQQYSVVAYILKHDAYERRVHPRVGFCLFQLLILTDDFEAISSFKHSGVNLNASCLVRSRSLFSIQWLL